MDISIVIPLLNEQNSLEELSSSVSSVINDLNLKYEIILIDDGSTDNSWKIISKICSSNKNIKAMQKKCIFKRISNAGLRESHVHDVMITKEAPNYQRG